MPENASALCVAELGSFFLPAAAIVLDWLRQRRLVGRAAG